MTVETDIPKVVTAATTVQVRQGEEGAVAGWLTEMNKTVATFPGYISAVVIPPAPPAQQDWVMVQRFQILKQLGAWLDSDERSSLLDKSASLLVDEGTTNVIEGASTERSPQDMVTEIITVSVKPGMEKAYRDWVERIRPMEAKFPGYQGLELQPPIPGLQDDWVSLLRFATAEHLNAWLESYARRAAVEEVEPFIDRRERQVTSAFSGWFTFGDAPGQVPPSWKQSMIVLLTLYPIVMLEQMFLNPLWDSLSLDMAEAIFIGNQLSLAATGFLLIPLALRLRVVATPEAQRFMGVEAAGIGLIVGLYALSIVVFAWLT